MANIARHQKGAGGLRAIRGRAGEQAAAEFLSSRGYRVLARNVRRGRWEIDLIATNDRTLVFVEVRTRRVMAYGSPAESVGSAKQRRLANAAEIWLRDTPDQWATIRFDVVAVTGPMGNLRCTHFPDAFRSPF